MANLDKIEETIRYIEELPDPDSQFNMSVWARQMSCGTTGCLAGWRYMMDYPQREIRVAAMDAREYAVQQFDLKGDEVNILHQFDCKTPEDLRIRVKDMFLGDRPKTKTGLDGNVCL